MKYSFSISMLILALSIAVVAGCKKDEADKNDLIGTYTRVMEFETGSSAVDLQFTDDGRMLWTLIGEVSGHSSTQAKYSMENDAQFKIYDDADCEFEDGLFSFITNGNMLTIEVVTDVCAPRVNALSGEWTRK